MKHEEIINLLEELMAKRMIQKNVHVVAVKNLNDGFFAAQVECRCVEDGQPRSCEIRKTGYIFGTDKEAIQVAQEMKRNLMMEEKRND